MKWRHWDYDVEVLETVELGMEEDLWNLGSRNSAGTFDELACARPLDDARPPSTRPAKLAAFEKRHGEAWRKRRDELTPPRQA